MPHTSADTLSLRNVFLRNGESRFARPVAAITSHALALRDRLMSLPTLTGSGTGSPPGGRFAIGGPLAGTPQAPTVARHREDMDVRKLEDDLAHAADHGDIERIERAFDRREAEGVHLGDWR